MQITMKIKFPSISLKMYEPMLSSVTINCSESVCSVFMDATVQISTIILDFVVDLKMSYLCIMDSHIIGFACFFRKV